VKGNTSSYQTIIRYFPGRPWATEVGVFQTVQLTGSNLGEEGDSIREDLRKLMKEGIGKRADRELRARRSRDKGAPTATQAISQAAPGAEAAADAFLAKLMADASESDGPSGPGGFTIDIRRINDQSAIEARVFPCFFWCVQCHRYYFVDPQGGSLECVVAGHSALRQLSAVYSCARCGNIEPILPANQAARNLKPGPLQCEKGNDLFLHLTRSFATARWECSAKSCSCYFRTQPQGSVRLSRYCHCNVSKPELLGNESISAMAPRSATAGEISVPLLASYVKDPAGDDVRLDGLRQASDGQWSTDSTALADATKQQIKRLGIDEMFVVPAVKSVLVNYGYRSEVRPTPAVPANERYPTFYQVNRKVPRYQTYYCDVDGAGVAIALNSKRLAALRPGAKFADAIAQEIDDVGRIAFQDLIARGAQAEAQFPILRTMHAIEHALRSSVILELGLEYFDSRILACDAAILIFETRDLGDGGIRQVTENETALAGWLDRAASVIQSCPQDCTGGCIACLATDNASCHGFLQNEFPRWIPPNALLTRKNAVEWMHGNA
jgi:hypothetical protein